MSIISSSNISVINILKKFKNHKKSFSKSQELF